MAAVTAMAQKMVRDLSRRMNGGDAKTPYDEGYESSLIGDGGKTRPCPYPVGSPEYDKWREGFDDATDDYMRNQD